MKITKTIANEIAIKMCENINTQIEECENVKRELVKKAVWEKIPENVKKLWETNSEYIKSEKYIQVFVMGEYNAVSLKESIPFNKNTRHLLNEKDSNNFVLLNQKIETLSDLKRKTINEIEKTLVTLGTYKRINDSFPEAIPFLPKIVNSEMIIDIFTIRNKVNSVLNNEF
jgi:hypothetical protein